MKDRSLNTFKRSKLGFWNWIYRCLYFVRPEAVIFIVQASFTFTGALQKTGVYGVVWILVCRGSMDFLRHQIHSDIIDYEHSHFFYYFLLFFYYYFFIIIFLLLFFYYYFFIIFLLFFSHFFIILREMGKARFSPKICIFDKLFFQHWLFINFNSYWAKICANLILTFFMGILSFSRKYRFLKLPKFERFRTLQLVLLESATHFKFCRLVGGSLIRILMPWKVGLSKKDFSGVNDPQHSFFLFFVKVAWFRDVAALCLKLIF
jgi:hypothetical protein